MNDLTTPNNTDDMGMYFVYLLLFMCCMVYIVCFLIPMLMRVYAACAHALYTYLNNYIHNTRTQGEK